MKIYEYQNNNQDAVIKLILEIQKKEYGLQITLEDQPDLLNTDPYGRCWIIKL